MNNSAQRLLYSLSRRLPLNASGRQTRAASQEAQEPQRTELYHLHRFLGGKFVNFGGYELPVQYTDQGIPASHLHTRKSASIFDVSHMLQTYVHGKDAAACIESVCTADIQGAANGSGTLTVFPNETGGILDDLIVTRVNPQLLYVVSNAAMKEQDMEIMRAAVDKFKAAGKDVAIEFLPLTEQSLIAVQGPEAIAALSKVVLHPEQFGQLYFMHTMVDRVAGVPGCRITRCGYTGEDGVEISIPSAHVRYVTDALLSDPVVDMKMAGLGARDSLRLEAGMCLYGSDIDATTSPIEAGLAWLVAKRRREAADFPGAAQICEQLKKGVSRRRVGLAMVGTGMPPARAGAEIIHEGNVVGKVTSGCPSPSVGRNIAMGYVPEVLKAPGTPLSLKVRGKVYAAEVTKMPFVRTHYYLKPQNK